MIIKLISLQSLEHLSRSYHCTTMSLLLRHLHCHQHCWYTVNTHAISTTTMLPVALPQAHSRDVTTSATGAATIACSVTAILSPLQVASPPHVLFCPRAIRIGCNFFFFITSLLSVATYKIHITLYFKIVDMISDNKTYIHSFRTWRHRVMTI